jgi:DNA-binding Lrp family transcriptional regulator
LLRGDEKEVLMELQYNFPEGAEPYAEIAAKLGIPEEKMLRTLRDLQRRGILKRVGFYVNYRSKGLMAALIAYSSNGRITDISKLYDKDPHATHVYLRDHPVYDIWVVTKSRSLEDLIRHAQEISRKLNIPYLLLYSRRTYKLSVKFDLYKGVSRAGPYSTLPENPPTPESLGINREHLQLYSRLPLESNPYKAIASRLGITPEDAARLAWELLQKGLLGDPGAAIDGKSVGFKENAMLLLEPPIGEEKWTCDRASNYPHTTHVVLRGVYPKGSWKYTCYAMLHAANRETLSRLIGEAVSRIDPADYEVLHSLADLKPGVLR